MACRIEEEFAIFVVADGLGGHEGGEKASRYFCDGLIRNADAFARLIGDRPEATLALWIDAAVDEMKSLFADDPAASEAHTTCAILYFDPARIMTAHCGDSRVYRLSPERILWRTRDHSVPQRLFEEGRISEMEIAGHPEQNCLLGSINVQKGHEVEINAYPAAQKDETFLLCSDGFWSHVKPQEVLRLAQAGIGMGDLDKLAKLSQLRAGGKSDNITLQWIRCLSE
ncbi:MAG: PP2C family protein-serine/threonine phosphatase, partial [Gammaproteobacteria bacterium]